MINSDLPTILAIETATDACSVAIYYKNNLKMKHVVEARGHTRLLFPMVEGLLSELGLKPKHIDALAFRQGPGSFTGVRIAASVIQALSLALDKPIVAVSSLRILAQGALRTHSIHRVCAVLESKPEIVYWGLFEKNAQGIMVAENAEGLISKSELNISETQDLSFNHQSWKYVTGYPEAQDLAYIARFELERGNITPIAEALPVYLGNHFVIK